MRAGRAAPTIVSMIEVESLTKRYGGRAVVEDLSFTVRPGRVTGFLGPNGAGKTTTLRMILGLARADGGRARIDGRRYAALPHPTAHVGAALEDASFHPGRSGRNHLRVIAAAGGHAPRRVDEVLAEVGLGEASERRVKGYSTGQRQRLAIAAALLGDPEVLILDEPANGLDPEGMRWMRELLREFADRGGTVLLSSHLLYEVEAVADQLLIIGGGRIVAQGTRDELLAGAGTLVCADEEDQLLASLDAARLPSKPAPDGGFVVDAQPDEVGRAALAGGVALTRLGPAERAGLEQRFFELTSGAPVAAEPMEAVR
jgi:ABC-2 type transport system ATP-binding protein